MWQLGHHDLWVSTDLNYTVGRIFENVIACHSLQGQLYGPGYIYFVTRDSIKPY